MNYSVSKLNTYFTCPKQYYYKYLAPKEIRDEERHTLARILGIGVHEAADACADDASAAVMAQTFQRIVTNSLEEAGQLLLKRGDSVPAMLETGQRLMKNYHEMLPQLQGDVIPKKEWWFDFPYRDGFKLVGKVDRVVGASLYDLKTGKYDTSKDFLPHTLQFAVYRLAFIDEFGLEPQMFYVSLANKRIYPVVLTEEYTGEPNAVYAMLKFVDKGIEYCRTEGYFPPVPRSTFNMSCYNCGFKHVCVG